jgi:hypothetical protein
MLVVGDPVKGHREQASYVPYRLDSLAEPVAGLGFLLIGLRILFGQPGLAALLTIAGLLLLVRHPA